jgi:KDO2-lipid IV(A) lauroyltransferase
VHVSSLGLALPPTVEAASLEINRAMEALVRQSPGQYLWGYARYKAPRDVA